MQRRIQQRDGVGQWESASEVCNGASCGCDAKATPERGLGGGNAAAADDHANEPRCGARSGHRGLDRTAWRGIETVKPGSGGSGEYRCVRQTKLCRVQPRHRGIRDLAPGIAAGTKSPPACAEQLRPRHAMPTRLFDSEGTFGQFRGNARSRRHAMNAGRCATREQRRLLRPSGWCSRYQDVPIPNGAHTRRW